MKNRMLIAGLILPVLLVLGVACASGSDEPEVQANAADVGTETVPQSTAAMSEGSASGGSSGPGGIWVVGEASISVEPDVSYINVGVSARADTVADARAQGAEAMDAIIAAVKAHDLTDNDIRTTSFSIRPQYDWVESEEDGQRVGKEVLVGYEVNNSARLTVRDLDTVGQIIDDAAQAGGDATRIRGISFSVEDVEQYEEGLREGAVADALAKADHLAELAGVSVGKLTFIGRAGRAAPAEIARGVAFSMTEDSMAASTQISGGQTEVSMRIQAAFSIE